ncbi:MAG: biotin/lipoyl-containing protein [Capsulimonadales bacterium]|nr:biotin/lipoyl-containing protein [Capsulimonadales bacterium]
MIQFEVVDYSQIEELTAVLRESTSLTELEVRANGVRLRLRRPEPPPRARTTERTRRTSVATALFDGINAVPPSAHSVLPKTETVCAGYVGVFHALTRSPIQVGDPVTEGQVLGQIETMRLLNDCTAPVGGRIQAILVMDGQPVEYGQPLFEIVPEE